MYRIIESHPDFLVISKQQGIDFHKGPTSTGLIQQLRNDLSCPSLFPVHRLDKVTSGLLLVAKSRDSLLELSRQFRERRVSKFYIAIGDGSPKKKQGSIIGDIKNGRDGVWILSRTTTKPSVTQFFSAGLGNGLRLYLLRPLTGRTHQIRVALKAIGAPVLGDDLYAGTSRYSRFAPDRAYLHAYALRFEYNGTAFSYIDKPSEGKYFLDEKFCAALSAFSEPWNHTWPKRS